MTENFETEAEREEREAIQSEGVECGVCEGTGIVNATRDHNGVWDYDECPYCDGGIVYN